MSRSRSSSPDPLRQFFSHSRSSSISSSSSPTAKDDLLAAITLESPCEVVEVLPAQIATVLHQETLIEMPGLKGGLKLSVDASPGCGGVVWPAGEIMSNYFLHLIDTQDPDMFAGKTVLELGAGTGIVSLVLGLKDSRTQVWCTDQEPLIPLITENIALNYPSSSLTSPSNPNVHAAILDWGEPSIPSDIPNPPDFVIMADCVYFEPSFPLLVHTLHLLTDDPARQPQIYLSYMKRRKADKRFFTQLRKHFETVEIEDDPRKGEYERKGLKMMRVVRKVGK